MTAMGWARAWRWGRILPLLVLLAALAVCNAAGAVGRTGRSACPPADPGRDHFFPPVDEPPLPPGTGRDFENRPLTGLGVTKALAFDFTRALVRGSEEQARAFVAPDVDFRQDAWRQRLGVGCPPDTFTVHRTAVRADEVVLEPTVYYADRTVTFRLLLRRYPDRWYVVAAEPRDGPAPGNASPTVTRRVATPAR